ncbi:MAG: PEGA domain-containing protein [Planctomycetota bacterium]
MSGRVAGLVLCGLSLGGCVERMIQITSEPPGALVTLNDQQLGRTPVETEFLFHGHYDVRLELEGYESVHESRQAKAPMYEWPVIDLLAAAAPVRLENRQEWHFELAPTPEARVESGELSGDAFEAELLDRARSMREQTSAEPE